MLPAHRITHLMKPLPIILTALAALALSSHADPEGSKTATGKKDAPLRVLHLTGGCCHDYEQQKIILTNGIAQRTDAVFTTVHEGGKGHAHQYELLKKKGWEKKFDAVLYNICFAREADVEYIESITATHKAGLPAVALHCTMHSHHWNAKTDTWEEFLGVSSRNHGPKAAITMTPTKKDHPVMKGFPASWKTPQGELYNVNKVYPSAIVLAEGDNGKTKQACVWVNEFGGTRIFGTTVGHHNETMAANVYLDLVTRGLLWTTHRLNDDGTPTTGKSK